MIKINQRVAVTVCRQEPNFDRACDTAYGLALTEFGADLDGYLNSVDHPNRYLTLNVEFRSHRKTGGMTGQTDVYEFEAWAC